MDLHEIFVKCKVVMVKRGSGTCRLFRIVTLVITLPGKRGIFKEDEFPGMVVSWTSSSMSATIDCFKWRRTSTQPLLEVDMSGGLAASVDDHMIAGILITTRPWVSWLFEAFGRLGRLSMGDRPIEILSWIPACPSIGNTHVTQGFNSFCYVESRWPIIPLSTIKL